MIVFLPASTSASQAYEAYETIGGLFTEITNDTLELSVTDKIWAYHFGLRSGSCRALLYRCYRVAGRFHRK